jgi:peptide/nickel transport system substrate-binding protein
MKSKLALRAMVAIASTALVATGLFAGAITPAQAATKSTVILHSSADITSLNSGIEGQGTSYNAVVGSLTGMGFTYYNSDAELVMNTKFGTMKIVKQQPKDFQIQYTVTKGQTWSDGTPIDAVDLLLTHVVASGKYSIDAGLGDPSADGAPAFNSTSYGGTYDDNVVGLPKLSADKMSLTVKFAKPLPDWELLAPGPSAVHALQLMADGKKGLQSASVNAAAKAKFLKAFTSKNTNTLKAMGKVYNEDYNVTKVDGTTNKLLLVSNGGFIVSKFTYGDSMTFVRNPKYKSGPAMATKNPIKTVVIKIIKDDTAAVQALRNGDLDMYYQTLPTAAGRITLQGLPNVTTVMQTGLGAYSHMGLRVDAKQGFTDTYTGLFAGNGTKAKDMRKAVLLATPREQAVDVLIKPVYEGATPLDTQFTLLQSSSQYKTITKGSGVSIFTTGTQAERTAQALAIVKKYYPSASAENPLAKFKFLHYNTTVRNNIAKLFIAEWKKAGFDVEDVATTDTFFDDIDLAAYDATMYGFGITALTQANSTGVYKTTGGSNGWGWSDSKLDEILTSLESDILTPKQVTAKRLAADKIIISNYWGLPLYANPVLAAFNKDLKNVKPAPIGNNLTWNFWEWSY